MDTLYKLADGKVEALEFTVGENFSCAGQTLRELKLCPVIRGSKSIIPDGNTQILAGDHAIIVASAGKLKRLEDMLA